MIASPVRLAGLVSLKEKQVLFVKLKIIL